jgi:hypothetical protein
MRTKPQPALVETAIPARLDRLRWGRFHTLVVVALGITWILDGLEAPMTYEEFEALAWDAANLKARQLGWIL